METVDFKYLLELCKDRVVIPYWRKRHSGEPEDSILFQADITMACIEAAVLDLPLPPSNVFFNEKHLEDRYKDTAKTFGATIQGLKNYLRDLEDGKMATLFDPTSTRGQINDILIKLYLKQPHKEGRTGSAYDKALTETIQEYLGDIEAKTIQPLLRRLIDNLKEDITRKARLYKESGGDVRDIQGELIQEFKERGEALAKICTDNTAFKDTLYKKLYERLKALRDEGKPWEELFMEIDEEEAYINEIFVRLVEEEGKVKVTSAKQLQELTGIKEYYYYWDEKQEEIIYDKGRTKKQAQEEAKKEVEAAFTLAMYYRYSTTLEKMLEAGAKYGDLLQVTPGDFNLPKTWSGTLATDQRTAILWAIALTLCILDSPYEEGIGNLVYSPSLRNIAREIEAPYSVVMEAFNLGG